MSSCVEKLVHEECGGHNLQVFFNQEEKTYTGFCFNCSSYIPDPYKDKPKNYAPKKLAKTQEQIDEELREIGDYPTVDIPSRKLTKDALSHFGVKVAVSEQDGTTPVAVYFPYYKNKTLVGYKARLLDKKMFWTVGNLREADLFGWKQALDNGGKKLFITEGEFDAVALLQALQDRQRGTDWEHLVPSVVSLPSGSTSVNKAIGSKVNEIKGLFKEVVLVYDQDQPGEKAVQDTLQILPNSVSVKLPSKDANQCLIDGRKKGLADACLFKTKEIKTTRLIKAGDLFDSAMVEAKPGLSWPWEWMTDTTRGIRYGETIYIGAGVKMGKSEVVDTIASHLIREHSLPVFMAKPEQEMKRTIKKLAGKLAGKVFDDPKVAFDKDAFEATRQIIAEKVWLLDNYQHLGWDNLRQDIIAAVNEGCKAVFIDPITNLTNGIHSGEANTKLQEVAQDISAMAKDMDFVAFIFCHLKAPDGGPPHERGGQVFSHQFAGSRAMMRSCNYMIGIEGNKDPNLEEESRNIRKLVMLEDREFGTSGFFQVYWDRATGLFNELKGKR